MRQAVSLVCDPEYPEVTIAELGILERVSSSSDGGAVRIELVPTMLGCPALDLIARDVTAAAQAACADLGEPAAATASTAAGITATRTTAVATAADSGRSDGTGPVGTAAAAIEMPTAIEVVFVDEPVWTTERISPSAAGFLAREYSVAVRVRDADAVCPICGSAALEHRSDFGPTPCRSVEWCPDCRNPVEVVGRVDSPLRRVVPA